MIALVILIAFDRIEHISHRIIYRTLHVVLPFKPDEIPEQRCRELLSKYCIRVQEVPYRFNHSKYLLELTFRLRTISSMKPSELVKEFGEIEKIAEIEWH